MKKSIFISLLAGILLSVMSMTTQAKSITLCHENENIFPWLLKEGKGLNIVLLEMVAAKSKIDLKLESMTWKRCLAEIENGHVDGGFGASYKDERAQYAVYPTENGKLDSTRRIRNDTYSLYRIKGNTVDWDGKKFSNLAGVVGAQSGYSIVGDLQKLGVETDDGARPCEVNMQKLIAGRIQAFAALTLEADQTLKTNREFAAKIEKIKTPLADKPYFVIFGKSYYNNNRKTVEDFWNMIGAVRNSAAYQTKQSAVLKSNAVQ